MKRPEFGGGWQAIWYTLRKAREMGGWLKAWKAMTSKNACKTCALGMGGQKGGMTNEAGGFPEVCKKSLQAMASDLQGAINPDFWETYSIPQMQKFSPRDLETCGRLVQPVVLEEGTGYYKTITWDDAMGRIVRQLKKLPPDETFWYFSGRSSNEAGFLLQLFARIYGTNNVNNCSFYCHQASGVGLQTSIGNGTASVVLEDVEHADFVFVIGGNPPSNHPRLMTSLAKVRNRGGQVISINPVIETGLVNFRVPSSPWSMLFGTEITSLYVQPHIGGDLALLTGVAKKIVEMNAHDEAFLREHCENADAWLAHLKTIPWPEIYEKSGVTAKDIDDIAARYAKAKKVVFSWTMGITHHAHGVQNVQAIANLALLRGMVGKEHAGLLPIRGHSNVQGIGSMGVSPQLKTAVFDRLQKEFNVTLPTTIGRDTLACMEGADDGSLHWGFCLGGNLYGSNPDASYAARVISKLDQIVYLNTTLNTGHAHGLAKETIILPVLARDEEPEPTTQESMFNYIRLSDGGPRRHDGPRSEVEIIANLAEEVLGKGPVDWRSMQQTASIRAAIAKVIPGFEQIDNIEKTKKEFQIPGRTIHAPKFPTPSGRAIIHVHSLPDLPDAKGGLRLMTVRSEGQFNTVVYEDYDVYRGQERRDIILMHPDDLKRLGLKPEQLVRISSSAGEMKNILARPYDYIRAGNALMYYPESNVLVPRTADPKSRTPAFKSIMIQIEPMSAVKKDPPKLHALAAH